MHGCQLKFFGQFGFGLDIFIILYLNLNQISDIHTSLPRMNDYVLSGMLNFIVSSVVVSIHVFHCSTVTRRYTLLLGTATLELLAYSSVLNAQSVKQTRSVQHGLQLFLAAVWPCRSGSCMRRTKSTVDLI